MADEKKPEKTEEQGPKPWLGRHAVISDDDHPDLDARAAIFEFKHGLPQDQAEQQAHHSYVKDKALDAAAHHFVGLKAAHHSGSDKAAKQHAEAYAGSVKAAGHDPFGPVPDEVLDRVKTTQPEVYRFKAHPADLLVEPLGPKADEADQAISGYLDKISELRDRLKRTKT